MTNAMVLKLNLNKPAVRAAFAVAALALLLLLAAIVVARFALGTLADNRVAVTRELLQRPLNYFPGSARLNWRMANAELAEGDRDLASAGFHAARAVNLSPYDHRFRLTLAQAQEAAGDRAGAEASLEAAKALAPNYWNVHYRLGNLLLREGKLDRSLDELRLAVAGNPPLMSGVLDLVWRASRENVDAAKTVAGNDSQARLALAGFLLKSSRADDAAAVFGEIPIDDRLASATESSAFLNSLIAAGKLEAAHRLWSETTGVSSGRAAISNGGFEADLSKNFAQFDWAFNRSDYARLSIDTATAHSGSKSLKIEFAGRDTTRLDNEVKQLALVHPGARYSVECYVKTSGLDTPEGPRLVITDIASNWIAAGDPIPRGSNDWQRVAISFTAPQSSNEAAGVFISIKRKPKFSYDEPTRGTIWFDDFTLNEL